jgi:hypothetical protein
MQKKLFSALILASVLTTLPVFAQNPAASQQVDALRLRQFNAPSATNAAPEFYPGETSDVGPQSLLELKQRRHWLRAFADEQLFYSDNVFLADGDKQGADVLVSTINVALAPDAFNVAGGKLAPQVGYQHQWFSYGLLGGGDNIRVVNFDKSIARTTNSINAFDFNVQTIFADTTFAWRGWDFTVGLDYRRFLDSNDYNEFYREIVPRLAAHYTFQFSETKSILVGYEGDYRATETANPLPINKDNYNDRTDHSFILLGNWKLCNHAIIQPFYRLQYSYFTHIQNGREDWLNTFGIALQLPLTQNVALRTFISYETLDSSSAYVQNYDKLDIGGGLNLSVRF